jgi:hypothetical protein
MPRRAAPKAPRRPAAVQDEENEAPGPPAEPTPDLYAVLGVERDVKEEELKKVYRKLALRHHPGAAPNAQRANGAAAARGGPGVAPGEAGTAPRLAPASTGGAIFLLRTLPLLTQPPPRLFPTPRPAQTRTRATRPRRAPSSRSASPTAC